MFLAIVSFVKGLQEAGSILGKGFSSSSTAFQYDAYTKEALIAVARNVDLFFLQIESSSEKSEFSSLSPTFIKIKSDLRSVLLRNKVRPLNEIAVKQSELLLEQWSTVEQLLKLPDGTRPAAMRDAREIMFQAFGATLTLEEAKRQIDK